MSTVASPSVSRARLLAAQASDRRRHHRVTVSLLGRYMLSDRREYPCQTVDISPGGVRLVCAVTGEVGERTVIYLEHLGRIEGTIARVLPDGFAVAISATAHKREKIASQLTWLANRASLGLPEDRRHERVVPRQTAVTLRLDTGVEVPARLIDVSLSGAALACDLPLAIDSALLVGRTPCRVVRQFRGGIAVEFRLPISPDRFDENLVL
ncbi:type IV pilus assembly PilZ [Methylobacterium sp. 4-46]|uniref:PilZ domain-containing protein n=1 Tax=unclassified Methylobacterium TaxID=2615210 RepID=UPI000152CA93|nr:MULTISPECIES: PilZ domain-containing protein [Methylobacterium]ACA17640.1 type IV pilus assembly PilZ [Methylobacterium sp. 4-46]WFT83311.1 PilZ domain-containing protein [Methylobacterium nodulans]